MAEKNIQAQNKPQNSKQTPAAKSGGNAKGKKKTFDWKAWLISLGITVLMLGIVVAAQYWFVSTTNIQLEQKSVWIGNAIGGIIMLFIVHHFVKKPKDDPYQQQ